MEKSGLPRFPTANELGLGQASDGRKKVPYNPTRPRNVRAFQTTSPSQPIGTKTTPTRFVPATPPPPAPSKPYPSFVIGPHVDTISAYIKKIPILAVDAPTGTGKTRALPYQMAKEGFKVRVAIPTTVAVRDAYNFQKIHSSLRVGYAAGREIHYTDDDQLVYATTGHFRQRTLGMIKSGQVSQIRAIFGDIVFIDEVHSATTDITILIALLRYLFTFKKIYNGPKIVFSTATFNHGDIMDHFPEFPIYKVPTTTKPIEDIFLDKTRDPIRDDADPEILRIVKQKFEEWKGGKKVHGIIFRPGANEVESTIEALETNFPASDPIEFFPAYSSLTPQEIDSIFVPSDKMKVVVGTNLIESSITIPDVGWIIDDMLVKIAETSSTGGERLTLTLISKAGSQQRRGRTGRTVPGQAYYLISKVQYESLNPFILREIDRIPIYEIVLQLIDAGLDTMDVLRINKSRYEQAKKILIDFGMIEEQGPRLTVTEAGKFVSGITLGIQNAFMVYLGYQRFMGKWQKATDIDAEKILFRSIIALACMVEIYGPSYMFIPRKKRDESQIEYQSRKDAHIEEYHQKFRGATDVHTLINIFWEMMTDINVAKQHDNATNYKFTHYVREWAINNSMNNKKLKEFLIVMRDIESTVESKIKELTLRDVSPVSAYTEVLPRGLYGQDGFSLGTDLPTGGFSALGNAIAPTFARAYIANHMRLKATGKAPIYVDGNDFEYRIDRGSSFNEIPLGRYDAPPEIVAARTLEIAGERGSYRLAGLIVSESYIPRLREVPEKKVAAALPSSAIIPNLPFPTGINVPYSPLTPIVPFGPLAPTTQSPATTPFTAPSLSPPPRLILPQPGTFVMTGINGLPVLTLKK